MLGMKSETIKCEILDQAKEIRHTMYKDVGIGPDQTKKQKQAEVKLAAIVEKKNKKELTEQDKAKNFKWTVVGQRGGKRVVKVQEREKRGEWREQSIRGGRGRGRGRGTWSGNRGKRMRTEEDMEEDIERPRTSAIY